MKISIVTDEISADPETAIELGVEWGVHDFEIRGFFSERVPRLTQYQKLHLHDVLAEHDARIIAVGPGLFKMACPQPRPPRLPLAWMEQNAHDTWAQSRRAVDHHLDELLPASLEFAHEFGAGLVVIFGFDRAGAPPGPPPEEVLDWLRRAAERAGEAGMRLALENEDGFWADTGARTAGIVRAVNHPSLGVNWDPGNAFFAGDDPYPDGYREIRGLVRHVHFKDARRDQAGSPYCAVEGQIDWAGQLQALARDAYDGWISIETHMRPKVMIGRESLERLRLLMDAAQADSVQSTERSTTT
jgi:sugar phosphate isomerase/epimerase